MIKKYEDACREAGLSKEQIREIRRMFDADKKRTYRRNSAMERQGLFFYPLSALEHDSDSGVKEFDIPDDFDLEETVIWGCLLKDLEKELALLEPQERDFILKCFDSSFSVTAYARETGIPRQTIQSRRDRLIGLLREKLVKK